MSMELAPEVKGTNVRWHLAHFFHNSPHEWNLKTHSPVTNSPSPLCSAWRGHGQRLPQ